MNIYDKARELGELILASEQSLRRADAQAAFEADDKARQLMQEYQDTQMEIQQKMESGGFSQEDFRDATQNLSRMGNDLKKHPIAGGYIEAENEFNRLVNQVMDIIKQTVLGEENGCDCGGSCGGGCGHHHHH